MAHHIFKRPVQRHTCLGGQGPGHCPRPRSPQTHPQTPPLASPQEACPPPPGVTTASICAVPVSPLPTGHLLWCASHGVCWTEHRVRQALPAKIGLLLVGMKHFILPRTGRAPPLLTYAHRLLMLPPPPRRGRILRPDTHRDRATTSGSTAEVSKSCGMTEPHTDSEAWGGLGRRGLSSPPVLLSTCCPHTCSPGSDLSHFRAALATRSSRILSSHSEGSLKSEMEVSAPRVGESGSLFQASILVFMGCSLCVCLSPMSAFGNTTSPTA